MIPALWQGGMSFHGGLIGVLLAIWYFAYRVRILFLTIADLVATICPISIFLVRIGNFINSEHWGRPTAVPWAIVFPAGIGLCANSATSTTTGAWGVSGNRGGPPRGQGNRMKFRPIYYSA